MQKYISNELSHFVGRTLKNDYDRFELLNLIVDGGELVANLSNPDKPALQVHNNYRAERLGEIYEVNDCVCFCDIPHSELTIHVEKYSKFGISFTKDFIGKNGGRPVIYVPLNYNIKEKTETIFPKQPNEYFNVLLMQNINLSMILQVIIQSFDFVGLVHEAEKHPVIGQGIKLFDKKIGLTD